MDALLNTAPSLAKNSNTGKVASAVSPKIRTANLGRILTQARWELGKLGINVTEHVEAKVGMMDVGGMKLKLK